VPGLVVDASVAGGWFIGDESSSYTEAALAVVADNGALVPGIWPFEIANMLAVAERRERATAEDVSEALRLLSALPVAIDSPHAMSALPRLSRLARDHGLTAYDASYLDLALRTGSVLATRDAELQRAAPQAGVTLFAG
jgi:predicted nucleic acid-binding protein